MTDTKMKQYKVPYGAAVVGCSARLLLSSAEIPPSFPLPVRIGEGTSPLVPGEILVPISLYNLYDISIVKVLSPEHGTGFCYTGAFYLSPAEKLFAGKSFHVDHASVGKHGMIAESLILIEGGELIKDGKKPTKDTVVLMEKTKNTTGKQMDMYEFLKWHRSLVREWTNNNGHFGIKPSSV